MQAILEYIFAWEVFSLGVGTLLAAAFLLVSDEFKQFKAATICLYTVAVWTFGKVLMWSYVTSDRFRTRAIVTFLVFGTVGVALTETGRLFNRRKARPDTKSSQKAGADRSAPIEQKSSGPNSPNIVGNGNQVIINANEGARPDSLKYQTKTRVSELIQITASAGMGNYAPGIKIGNIEWKPFYSEVQVTFFNSSSKDYEDFDVAIDTDQVIYGASQTTDLPDIRIFTPGMIPGSPLPPNINERRQQSGGNVPLPNEANNLPRRVRCSKFPRQTGLQVVLAVANVKSPVPGGRIIASWGQPDLGPKILPKWVNIEGTYRSDGIEVHLSKKQEFTVASLP